MCNKIFVPFYLQKTLSNFSDIEIPNTPKMKIQNDCETQCVAVSALREKYGKDMNLERWCADPNNVLCCRHGRVFIHEIDPENPDQKIKHVFAYPESKWHNPFKVGKDGTLEEVCKLFETHVLTSELRDQLGELVGKTLGCFCDQSTQCHTQTLQKLVGMRHELCDSVAIISSDDVDVSVSAAEPIKPAATITSTTTTNKSTKKAQCQAQTKAKNQCSKNAKEGGKYCAQHQKMYGK